MCIYSMEKGKLARFSFRAILYSAICLLTRFLTSTLATSCRGGREIKAFAHISWPWLMLLYPFIVLKCFSLKERIFPIGCYQLGQYGGANVSVSAKGEHFQPLSACIIVQRNDDIQEHRCYEQPGGSRPA